MIDYKLLAKAIEAYEREGYKYVDTPWIVGAAAVEATLPPNRHGFDLTTPDFVAGKLVGSAEQGFLQMMLDGTLKPGRYQSAGPCFRDEPVLDAHHQYAFFKLELIEYLGPRDLPITDGSARYMAHQADLVMWKLFDKEHEVKCVATESGYDLEIRGVEVGSYGAREAGGHRWVYGTGLALPRATLAVGRR